MVLIHYSLVVSLDFLRFLPFFLPFSLQHMDCRVEGRVDEPDEGERETYNDDTMIHCCDS
jgi:hypothetical protein